MLAMYCFSEWWLAATSTGDRKDAVFVDTGYPTSAQTGAAQIFTHTYN